MRARCEAVLAALALLLVGCPSPTPPYRPDLTSFTVKVTAAYLPRAPGPSGLVEYGSPGTRLPVVSPCVKKYGAEAEVPDAVRGTLACRYELPRGMSNPPYSAPCPLPASEVEAELEIEVLALGKDGQPLTTFTGPVSIRVVPGALSSKPEYRWIQVTQGVGKGVVKVAHMFGEVRVWVEDAPPKSSYLDGEPDPTGLPPEPQERTWATGLAQPVWFQEPTLARIQIPDGFDNKCSPYVGRFLKVGATLDSPSRPVHSCPEDSERDGVEPMLVVTGTDPSGFFVTDANACRMNELLRSDDGQTHVRVPEPGGRQPGTFGSIFIYNYSYPEGLERGDLLWTLAGAVQEFTATTQMTFPSWTVRKRVRDLPQSERNKYLDLVPIPEITLRTCGLDNTDSLFVTDTSCGHNRRNLKLESLESALVQVKNVRMPQVFTSCDRDGDGTVPFFCESPNHAGGDWIWGACGDESSMSPVAREEMACNIDCVNSLGSFRDTVCSERATFATFGQFTVELAGPGPKEAQLDDSLPARIEKVLVTATSKRAGRSYQEGAQLRVFCGTGVRVSFGAADVEADETSLLLPANTRLDRVLGPEESHLALLVEGEPSENPVCHVAQNPRTRINLVTKDAMPELEPDCSPEDQDPERARQCRYLRGATYDVVGHLRHLQPGRPRWVLLPRDKDDLCCHPGPGLECPRPIRACL